MMVSDNTKSETRATLSPSPPATSTLTSAISKTKHAQSRSPSSLASEDGSGVRTPTTGITTVPAACLACRGKHLKCDGQKPCRRCTDNNLECVYVASRRGYKGPRRKYTVDPVTGCTISGKKIRERSITASASPASSVSSCDGVPPHRDMSITSASRSSTSSLPGTNINVVDAPVPNSQAGYVLPHQEVEPLYDAWNGMADDLSNTPSPQWANMMLGAYPPPPTTSSPAMSQISYGTASSLLVPDQFSKVQQPIMTMEPSYYDQCINAFYANFYPAHPVGPPRERLLSRAYKLGNADVCPLMTAIRWAGSRYLSSFAGSMRLDEMALQQLYSPTAIRDGYLVQALLIVAICLHSDFQRETAWAVCADAERLAIEIGMYSNSYAVAHGMGDPRFEDSWRSTWWELHSVSTMLVSEGSRPAAGDLLYDVAAGENVVLSRGEDSFPAGYNYSPLSA